MSDMNKIIGQCDHGRMTIDNLETPCPGCLADAARRETALLPYDEDKTRDAFNLALAAAHASGYAQAREDAAKVCDERAARTRAEVPRLRASQPRGAEQLEGYAREDDLCASAIRALPAPQRGENKNT